MEDDLPGIGRDDRRLAVKALDGQRDQAVAFALPLVGDELVHVPGGQQPRVMAAAGSAELKEGAQLQPGPPHVVEGAPAARAARRSQDAGKVIPDQAAQPPLGHSGQVDAAGTAGQLPPEMLSEDVAVIPGLLRRHVETPEGAGDCPRDADAFPPGRRAQAGVVQAQIGQGAQRVSTAVVRQPLQRGHFPPPALLSAGVPGHAPLDLGPHQRVQAAEVELRRPHHRRGRGAPPAERRLVGVLDGNGQAGPLVAAGPLRRQRRPAGPALRPVACLVPGAQAQRRDRRLRADADAAAAIAGNRVLDGQPQAKVSIVCVPAPVAVPAELMVMTQPQGQLAGRTVRAYPARLLLCPLARAEQRSRPEEAGPRSAFVAVFPPQDLMSTAQVTVAHRGTLAFRGQAVPPVNGMPGGNLDDVFAEQRVEGRRADQRGQDLQPVPAFPGIMLRQDRHGHRASPQTVRRAVSKAGSCTSTCP